MSNELLNNLFALSAVFVVLIVPIWLILHYVTRWKLDKRKFAQEDIRRMHELEYQAEQMDNRLRVLESILDRKAPEWRDYRD